MLASPVITPHVGFQLNTRGLGLPFLIIKTREKVSLIFQSQKHGHGSPHSRSMQNHTGGLSALVQQRDNRLYRLYTQENLITCFSVHTHYTVQFSISTQWAKRNSQGLWKNIENAAGLEPSGEVNQAQGQEEEDLGEMLLAACLTDTLLFISQGLMPTLSPHQCREHPADTVRIMVKDSELNYKAVWKTLDL